MSNDKTSDGRKTKVFMSYSRKDSAYVSRLIEGLEREDDIEVFRDTDDILPTEEWKDRLEQLIGEADTIVFALSPHSAKSEICRWEVDHAESLNKRIAPIVIRDVAASRIPEPLTKYNYIFFTRGHDFDKALANLITALDADIDWIREHTRLGEIARRWEEQQRLGAQPLRGRELEAAEQWLAAQPTKAPNPTGPHRQYIADSRRAATQRQRNWVVGSLAAVVVTGLLAAYAFLQKQEAERNLAQALSAADTLVVEIATGMKDFTGVPIARVRSVLEKAEGILKSLESAGNSDEIRYRQARMLHALVGAHQTLGDFDRAQDRANRSISLLRGLVTQDPANADWMLGLSLGHNTLGDVLKNKGDVKGAENAYRAYLATIERLANAEPENTVGQYNLAAAHDKIGTVLKDQGDLAGAFSAYRTGFTIIERLAASDLANTVWQRDLSVSHENIGSVLQAQGDLEGAEKAFRASLKIIERLAASEPANTAWQYVLSFAHMHIGAVLQEQGNLAAAEKAQRASFVTIERLAKSDPENAQWQADLAISHGGLGQLMMLMDKPDEALPLFEAGRAILRRVTVSSGNTLWQDNLDRFDFFIADAKDKLAKGQ